MEDKETVKKTRKIKTEEEKPIKTKKETIKTEDIKKSLEFSLTEVIVIILVTALLVSIVSGVIVFRNYDKISAKKIQIQFNKLRNKFKERKKKNMYLSKSKILFLLMIV